jgi:putative two-component system response regulator
MLHDIGKIAIPDAILTKPGKLTTEEFEIMKRHSELGETLLSGSGHPFLELAARVARSHHERWNGSGYPDGLVREACFWEARVVGVVDVFDALAETRCYKEGWPQARIVEFFRAERGRLFDPDITDALLSIVSDLEIVKSMHPDPPLPITTNEPRPLDAVSGRHHHG